MDHSIIINKNIYGQRAKISVYVVFLAFVILLGSIGGGLLFAKQKCEAPIGYAIGSVDPRFGKTEAEIRQATDGAAKRWNQQSGKELLRFEADAKLKINLIYDERQQRLDEIRARSGDLASQKGTVEELKARFQSELAQYQADLREYNKEVDKWNKQGGAPTDIYNQLQQDKYSLDQQRKALIELGDKLNIQVDSYNSDVTDLNNVIDESKGSIITQGVYKTPDEVIEIYTFGNFEELRLVLMHELGHALSFDHVTGEKSIMYYLLSAQDLKNPVLSDEDLALVGDRCDLSKKTFYLNLFNQTRQKITY
jgi:uncharacterized protein YukE